MSPTWRTAKGPRGKDPRLATIGVFIAVLSGAMAWMYAQPAERAVVVESVDGTSLGVECADGSAHSELGTLRVPLGAQQCAIFVYGGNGSSGRVTLDARLPGRYRCRVVEGELECVAR